VNFDPQTAGTNYMHGGHHIATFRCCYMRLVLICFRISVAWWC